MYLARTIPDAAAAKVEKLLNAGSLPGIYTMQEPKRFYPDGQLASPLVGLVGIDDQGLSGLEYKYNGLLEGKPGKLVEDMDPAGGQIPGGVQEYQAPVRGDDLVLSIDEPLQYEAEQALARAIVAAQADSGMALIMDSHTGEAPGRCPAHDADPVRAGHHAGASRSSGLVHPAREFFDDWRRGPWPKRERDERGQRSTGRSAICFRFHDCLRARVSGKTGDGLGRPFHRRGAAR